MRSAPDESPLGVGDVAASAARAGAIRHFLQSGVAYWALMLLAGLSNLVFTVLAARFLGPDAYGIMLSLTTLINVILIASTAVTRTATAVVAATADRGVSAWILQRGTGTMVLAGLFLMGIIGVLARPLADFLHLSHPAWIWIVGAAMVPCLAGGITTGILQGMRMFSTSGGVNLSGAAMKLGALVLLLDAGLGVTGATLATLFETTVIWVGGMVILYRMLRGVARTAPGHAGAARSLFTLPAALSLARLVFFNLDILLAKHYLSAEQAGLFGALAMTGRIIAYGTGALPPVVYPYLVRHRSDRALSLRYLLLCQLATAVTGTAAVAALVLAPSTVVDIVYGSKYVAGVAPFVGWYGLAFLLYSLMYVTLHYLLAIESRQVWVYAAGGGVVELVAMVIFHRGIGALTAVEVVFFGVLFIVTSTHAVVALARTPATAAPASQ